MIFLFSSILFTYTANSQTFFFTADNGRDGVELWKSDGTNAGTKMVANINATANRAGSNPSQLTMVGTTLFFTADNGRDGVELWKSDGTNAGTKMVANINATSNGASSNPSNITF